MTNRLDYQVIHSIVQPSTRILDLGCGDGELLALLRDKKNTRGVGIEIDEKAIRACIEKGLAVVHGDIDHELSDYADKRFDYVILYESLQQVLHPERVILEALRVGKKVIVGIPNFCHAYGRYQVFFRGKVPVTKELPYQWYDTPNLRFLSLKDFRIFCKKRSITIEQEIAISRNSHIHFFPNVFAHVGIFELSKE
ncbi:MAG: methionine biosynthesis protein MetW [Candidatus Omnitrophica bacterium]|nr:methionine biosynthesis protein MetW [Candidatus Omnitrophota bacterium]